MKAGPQLNWNGLPRSRSMAPAILPKKLNCTLISPFEAVAIGMNLTKLNYTTSITTLLIKFQSLLIRVTFLKKKK